MLAQMGWSAGQSLGLTMPGLTENLKVAYKMDNKGIGAQRHEREARANGKDIWVGGGGDLGSLFERLNAANAASASSSAVASSSSSVTGEDGENQKNGKKSKKDKKDKKDKKGKKDKKDKKDKSSGDKTSKKRKHDDSDELSSSDKSKKSKKGKKDKSESKKSKRGLQEKEKVEAVEAVASADPALAKDPAAVDEIKKDVVQGRPVRLAHRAKFLRAKRMVSANDLASVNEILGIASTSSSSAAGTPKATSGTSTPTTAAPKTYPGPGGSEIALMDVDRRLVAEQDVKTDSDDKESKKKDKKDKKHKKKMDKEAKKSKASSSVQEAATPSTSDDKAAADAAAALAAEDKEKLTQIGTNSQGLFVFEYLNRRLMMRKAQIQRQKKAEQEAVFARAARVGA